MCCALQHVSGDSSICLVVVVVQCLFLRCRWHSRVFMAIYDCDHIAGASVHYGSDVLPHSV